MLTIQGVFFTFPHVFLFPGSHMLKNYTVYKRIFLIRAAKVQLFYKPYNMQLNE